MFWHTETKSLLIVDVDDFKLAAREEEHDALWSAIRRVINMDPETLDGRFLGFSHERSPQRQNRRRSFSTAILFITRDTLRGASRSLRERERLARRRPANTTTQKGRSNQ